MMIMIMMRRMMTPMMIFIFIFSQKCFFLILTAALWNCSVPSCSLSARSSRWLNFPSRSNTFSTLLQNNQLWSIAYLLSCRFYICQRLLTKWISPFIGLGQSSLTWVTRLRPGFVTNYYLVLILTWPWCPGPRRPDAWQQPLRRRSGKKT